VRSLSSRLKSPSSSPAYGARLDRNRIQTDVSTKTIMQLRDRVLKPAHVAGESRGAWLGSAERAQPLVRAVANQRSRPRRTVSVSVLAPQADLAFSQQPLVDMKGLLHNITIMP